jgi:hypothetical protein
VDESIDLFGIQPPNLLFCELVSPARRSARLPECEKHGSSREQHNNQRMHEVFFHHHLLFVKWLNSTSAFSMISVFS